MKHRLLVGLFLLDNDVGATIAKSDPSQLIANFVLLTKTDYVVCSL